jgi:hypothetical protein
MKSPVQNAVTKPLYRIEDLWRAEHDAALAGFDTQRTVDELHLAAWKELTKRAFKGGKPTPSQPVNNAIEPKRQRLVLSDSTFEKLHEILSANPSGVLVLFDELTGWLANLDRSGREGERAFFLTGWNGDSGFTVDRIGRGSVHVPAVCLSVLGGIQPARLRQYLADAVDGGPGDDGLIQRFQMLVWPDPPRNWKLVDRPANESAMAVAERVFFALSKLSPANHVRNRFSPEGQELFFEWLESLELKVRGNATMHPAMVSHLAKYRSLMPTLAMNFMLADRAATASPLGADEVVDREHAQQAVALCAYLESHAHRVYGCITSPEARAARELGRHLQARDLADVFSTRDVYRRGWTGLDTRDRAEAALSALEDADWLKASHLAPGANGGRPSQVWAVNPRVYEMRGEQ